MMRPFSNSAHFPAISPDSEPPMEMKAMRRMKVPYSWPLLFSTLLFVSMATAQSLSAQSATFFISCSTLVDGGIDTYYTGVFAIGAVPGDPPRGPYAVGANIGGTWMVPAVSSQTILDHFQAYLTQKGYKFKPGSSSACDVKPTEAAAKAAQHKRAYEGGGCSSCGKVVETGWKYTP